MRAERVMVMIVVASSAGDGFFNRFERSCRDSSTHLLDAWKQESC